MLGRVGERFSLAQDFHFSYLLKAAKAARGGKAENICKAEGL